MMVFALALAIVASTPLAATASPVQDTASRLATLARSVTFDWAREHPLEATALGISSEDGDLDAPSEGARARDVRQVRGWQRTLAAIPLAGAGLVQRDDARLLRAQLTSMERAFTTYSFDRKDYSAGGNAIVNALFTQFQHFPVAGVDGATKAGVERAWERIIARMAKAPAYIAAAQRLVTEPCRLFGHFGRPQLQGAPDFINGALSVAAKEQLAPARFAVFAAARDRLLATLSATAAYIGTHEKAWPNNYAIGRAAYDAMLRDEFLVPFNGDAVQRMGYDELAHGWAEQIWYEHAALLQGTPLGPAAGGGIAPSGEALIPFYRDRIAQLFDFVKTHQIVTVPDWLGTVEVIETPKFLQPVSPGASMNPPRTFGSEKNGIYFITPTASFEDAAKHLDLFQDFDRDRILSTAAHEVMPGHYLQLSIARRHPDFVRRIQGSDEFSEGWAYYGEEMLTQLGLYGDDLDPRLDVAQWERIRGARAIVDVALASGAWSFERGVDFFAAQTGATRDESAGEVASFTLAPGSVISYTVGRFQLETLAASYRLRTGAKGSLLDFHDRLMCYGSTPWAIVAPELLADLSKPLAEVRAAANY